MHSAALHFAPFLGAEKSKVPFYIAGGALVVWAVTVSAGLGLRRAAFPGNLGGERVVIAISVALVLAVVSTAVVTAGSPAHKEASGAAPGAPAPGTAQTPPAGEAAPSGAPPPAAASPATSSTGSTPSGAPASPAASSLSLGVSPGGALAFDTSQLGAKAGKVSIVFSNASPIEHDVTIAQGSRVLGATPTFINGKRTLTLTLAPGAYTFYCSVPGHRQAGMEGTLSIS